MHARAEVGLEAADRGPVIDTLDGAGYKWSVSHQTTAAVEGGADVRGIIGRRTVTPPLTMEGGVSLARP